MTADEWSACDDPATMLRLIGPSESDRRLHLYAVACCRRIAPLLPQPESLDGVDVLERYADGDATADDVSRVSRHVEAAAFAFGIHEQTGQSHRVAEWVRGVERLPPDRLADLVGDPEAAAREAFDILRLAAYFVDACVSPEPWVRQHAVEMPGAGLAFQSVSLIRCVFGNPLRPSAFDPAYRTAAVVGLARAIYYGREFDAMPVLADALEEAGCDNANVLDHLRGPGPHARGCFVLDGVLGLR